MANEIEIRDYMDKKFDKFYKDLQKWKRWMLSIVLTAILTLIASGLVASRSFGALEIKTEYLWKHYVPEEMFYMILQSYDLQNSYFLGLINGDNEEANRRFDEFIEFRASVYDKYVNTRSGNKEK